MDKTCKRCERLYDASKMPSDQKDIAEEGFCSVDCWEKRKGIRQQRIRCVGKMQNIWGSFIIIRLPSGKTQLIQCTIDDHLRTMVE